MNPPIYHLCLKFIITVNCAARRYMYNSSTTHTCVLILSWFLHSKFNVSSVALPIMRTKAVNIEVYRVANFSCSIMHVCLYAELFSWVVVYRGFPEEFLADVKAQRETCSLVYIFIKTYVYFIKIHCCIRDLYILK